MQLETLRNRYRDHILHLAGKYRVEDVRVFGSTVRGEARADSDVDLLVHAGKGCSLLDIVGFEQDVSTLIATRVDVLEDVSIRDAIAPYIISEAVPL